VVLPTPGDPYITAIWLESYKKFWAGDIDQLYVCINSGVEESVFQYTVDMFHAVGAKILTARQLLSHGPALGQLIDLCQEDFVFIAEDDFYIQRQGDLAKWFSIVETGQADAVVSLRGCCSEEIISHTARRFGLRGRAAAQPNFWPSLCVIKKSNLVKTDGNYGAKTFKAGEPIPQINLTPTKTTGGDTFVWASIQLRALGLSFYYEDQNRLIDVIRRGQYPPPWIHVGSSSTSLGGGLLDEEMHSLGHYSQDATFRFPPVPDRNILEHFERKYAFWYIARHHWPIPENVPASYFNGVYADAITRAIHGCNLRQAEVDRHCQMFLQILAPLLSE